MAHHQKSVLPWQKLRSTLEAGVSIDLKGKWEYRRQCMSTLSGNLTKAKDSLIMVTLSHDPWTVKASSSCAPPETSDRNSEEHDPSTLLKGTRSID